MRYASPMNEAVVVLKDSVALAGTLRLTLAPEAPSNVYHLALWDGQSLAPPMLLIDVRHEHGKETRRAVEFTGTGPGKDGLRIGVMLDAEARRPAGKIARFEVSYE